MPRNVLASLRERTAAGVVAVAAMAAAFAVLTAWLTPRGPVTTTEALVTMAASFALGVAAGAATGRRRNLLVTPVAFTLVFEIARAGTEGLTVDAVSLGGVFGVIAFLVGRVFPTLLTWVPMILGGVYGIAFATRWRVAPARRVGPVASSVTGIGTLGVVLLAIAIARPASTAPIVGADGQELPGSVAELVAVAIGGHEQSILIRGRSKDDPVLLYLAGGPGGTDLGAIRRDVTLEQRFVVATWDQRGAGKSYAALDPTSTLTLDALVSDAVDVADYLRARFGQDKVYLVGQSWGSTLGVLAAQRHPDRFHAFVGVGQMVSQRETDILFWEDTLAWARATGNAALERTLVRNGPPPYEDVRLYDPVVSHEHDWNPYPEFDPATEMPAILFVPEYTFMDRVNAFRGFLDTNGVLYPQLQGIDFRVDVPSLEVPVVMVLGNREARGRAELAEAWFELLDAPYKASVVIEGGGHRAHFDRPGRFAEIMQEVLAATAPPAPSPRSDGAGALRLRARPTP